MSSCRPYVSITEQPAGRQQRFRYLSEVDGARSVGSIPGVNSTPERKTFPSIRVHGYKGPFVVLLSLLNPVNNLVHPHSITGSDPRYMCRHGVIFVISEEPEVVFKNIGILCVKGKTEKDVKSQLKLRKQMNIDPFGAGFSHIYDHRQIDFTAVHLCFQVFLPGSDWTLADRHDVQKYNRPLNPVVSDVVYDAKKLTDLKIVHINSCAGPVSGGNEMTLLCDKYTGQNPDVVFEDEYGWMQKATATIHHKQLAIVFVAPAYPAPPDRDDLKVKVYLQQTITNDRGVTSTKTSEPATVEYIRSDPMGSPIKYPTQPQSEKSSISLKQVRIPQRPCPGSPEDGRQKRWRPWGRGEPPRDHTSTSDSEEDRITSDQISQIYIRELENTAPAQTDMDGRCEVIPLFDPHNPELHAHEWLSTIDQLGDEYNWSDTVKSYYMQKRLSGIGKDWLSTLRHSDSWTWFEWKQKLLKAFPSGPRRDMDCVDMIRDWLANKQINSERVRLFDKYPLPARCEINTNKARARLVEGWPLHMRPEYRPNHCNHPETSHFLHHSHLSDREEAVGNAAQIQPLNLNKNNHMNIMDEQENGKAIFPNIVDYNSNSFDANSEDRHTRRYCYCNEEKGRVIRCCPPSRQNEMRASCIIRRNQIPKQSWHQPCPTTLTPSISSPSISNPPAEWFDQPRLIPMTNELKPKAEEKAVPRKINHMPHRAVLSPSIDPAELNYNPLDEHAMQHMNMPSNNRQMNSSNYIDGNIMISNIHDNVNHHVANGNQKINNVLPTTSGLNHLEPSFMYSSTSFHRGTPTNVKRAPNRVTIDSGEISRKRDKRTSPDLDFDITPTYVNLNNSFNNTKVPVPIPNSQASASAAGLPVEGEKPNTEEILAQAYSMVGDEGIKELKRLVAIEEQWFSERANITNSLINQQHNHDFIFNHYDIPNNVNQISPNHLDQVRPSTNQILPNNNFQLPNNEIDQMLHFNHFDYSDMASHNGQYDCEIANVSRELGRVNIQNEENNT